MGVAVGEERAGEGEEEREGGETGPELGQPSQDGFQQVQGDHWGDVPLEFGQD